MLDYVRSIFWPNRQTWSVLVAAAVIYAVYLSTAPLVARHEKVPPWPPGDPVRLLEFKKINQDGLPNGGFAYYTRALSFSSFEDSDVKAQKSPVIVYENDKPLGPARSDLYEVEKDGLGRYSHWKDLGIFFSTSDNSDPRKNGRAYFAVLPAGGR